MSLATASRVLNGSTRKVAESYRERVEAAAAKLGYTANLSAQATARGTSAIVALLVADIADPYFGQIASGVARGADEAGLVVTIAITERDPQREVRLVRALRGQRPRGLILAASRTEGPDAAGLEVRARRVRRHGRPRRHARPRAARTCARSPSTTAAGPRSSASSSPRSATATP